MSHVRFVGLKEAAARGETLILPLELKEEYEQLIRDMTEEDYEEQMTALNLQDSADDPDATIHSQPHDQLPEPGLGLGLEASVLPDRTVEEKAVEFTTPKKKAGLGFYATLEQLSYARIASSPAPPPETIETPQRSASGPVTTTGAPVTTGPSTFWWKQPPNKEDSPFPTVFEGKDGFDFKLDEKSLPSYESTITNVAGRGKFNGREYEEKSKSDLAGFRKAISASAGADIWKDLKRLDASRPERLSLVAYFDVVLTPEELEDYRIDASGNVIWRKAVVGSPLAWELDHKFAWAHGGLTVSMNLHALQGDINLRKKDQIWHRVDPAVFRIGISPEQFLASRRAGTFWGASVALLGFGLEPRNIHEVDGEKFDILEAAIGAKLQPNWFEGTSEAWAELIQEFTDYIKIAGYQRSFAAFTKMYYKNPNVKNSSGKYGKRKRWPKSSTEIESFISEAKQKGPEFKKALVIQDVFTQGAAPQRLFEKGKMITVTPIAGDPQHYSAVHPTAGPGQIIPGQYLKIV